MPLQADNHRLDFIWPGVHSGGGKGSIYAPKHFVFLPSLHRKLLVSFLPQDGLSGPFTSHQTQPLSVKERDKNQ